MKRNDFLIHTEFFQSMDLAKLKRKGRRIWGKRISPFIYSPASWSNCLIRPAPPFPWFPGKWSAIVHLPVTMGDGANITGTWKRNLFFFSFSIPRRKTPMKEPLSINSYPLFRHILLSFINHFPIHHLNWSNSYWLWKWSWRPFCSWENQDL